MKNLVIRNIKESEYDKVNVLFKESFWNVYSKGAIEHILVDKIRKTSSYNSNLEFVLLCDNKIIGYNLFYKAVIHLDDGKLLDILTMGPICIDKKYQKQGYGKYLCNNTIKIVKKLGYKAICIEGNYAFYSKCGFKYASSYNLKYHNLPADADASFFLCNELQENALKDIVGTYKSPYEDIIK